MSLDGRKDAEQGKESLTESKWSATLISFAFAVLLKTSLVSQVEHLDLNAIRQASFTLAETIQ